MGPYYDHAVEIHQTHLLRAEDNRLRRKLAMRHRRRGVGVAARAVLMVGVVMMVVQLV